MLLSTRFASSSPAIASRRHRTAVVRVRAAADDSSSKDAQYRAVTSAIDAKRAGSKKVLVTSIAPAVRIALSEALGKQDGEVRVGHLVAGLRKLGFDYVFDVQFAADLTIMEEGHELLHRLESMLKGTEHAHHHPLPMFTSCCPGWIDMVEKLYPELIPHVSTTKSPQMIMGATLKNYFSRVEGIEPSDILNVSIMPCVRKQGEAERPGGNTAATGRDVDHVITTTDVLKLLETSGIDISSLEEDPFDSPLGDGSGAAQLFGTTGGVMEAALRTVVELVEGGRMERLVYDSVHGLEGIRMASVTVRPSKSTVFYELTNGEPIVLRVAVANGLGNAKKLVSAVQAGEMAVDFVEIMACPGGCIGGAGQPRSKDKKILEKRQDAMYRLDDEHRVRRSHLNRMMQEIYGMWLEKPNSEEAYRYLHTSYRPAAKDAKD